MSEVFWIAFEEAFMEIGKGGEVQEENKWKNADNEY